MRVFLGLQKEGERCRCVRGDFPQSTFFVDLWLFTGKKVHTNPIRMIEQGPFPFTLHVTQASLIPTLGNVVSVRENKASSIRPLYIYNIHNVLISTPLAGRHRAFFRSTYWRKLDNISALKD